MWLDVHDLTCTCAFGRMRTEITYNSNRVQVRSKMTWERIRIESLLNLVGQITLGESSPSLQ